MPDNLGTEKIPRLAAAPAGPVAGQIYYDTIANEVRWYNGTIWVPAKDAGGGASAMTLIASQALVAAAATITFSSIPTGYSHLLLKAGLRGDQAGVTAVRVRPNADSGSVYNFQRSAFGGSTFTGGESFSQAAFNFGYAAISGSNAGRFNWYDVHIYDYLSAVHKSIQALGTRNDSDAGGGVVTEMHGGVWRNTAAITSLVLSMATGNFAIGSKAYLYGIL